jgi:hypothetical protein
VRPALDDARVETDGALQLLDLDVLVFRVRLRHIARPADDRLDADARRTS